MTVEELMEKMVNDSAFIIDAADDKYNHKYNLTEEGSEFEIEGIQCKTVQKTGVEENGVECVSVIKVGDDRYIKLDYTYYSYEGYDFSCMRVREVTPVVRMTTYYE